MVTSFAITLPQGIPTTVPALSTNALIVVAVALIFAYGFIAGHAALIRESISIYVGLVLANNFGKPAYDYILQNGGKSLPLTQTIVQLILLIVPIVLLQFGRRHHAGQHHHPVMTMILALGAAMLLVSSVLGQLDPLTLSHITDSSNLAAWIYELRLLWLALVPLAIAVSAIFGRQGRHH